MFECLEDFVGAWGLSRRIRHHNAPEASFEGEALFSRHSDGLLYHETGELLVEGQAAFRAERRYYWRNGSNGMIDVFFGDGREFHSIDRHAPDATHFCDPDTYNVRYRFESWPIWQAEWRVTGPKKDYLMVSTYNKM
ncbi:MAG: DUF6314 family protein [Pseudomonadota bacterium]